jgi:hypothetical protein
VEQVRANAADLVQVRERVRLRLGITMRDGQREGEDGRIVLGRASGIADLNDAVDGTDSAPRTRKRSSRVQSSTSHEKPPPELRTWFEPGIACDCGVMRRLN